MYNIFDKLKNYSDSDYYAFHMPGHKRNLDLMDGTSPYRIDITEIDGFDDLHHAEYQPGQTDASVIFQSVVAAGGGRPAAGAVRRCAAIAFLRFVFPAEPAAGTADDADGRVVDRTVRYVS